MALDNVQLSARITPLEQAVKALQSYECKKLVINTTYCYTISSSYVRYSKFGAIVVVEIYDISLKDGKSTDGVATIASGLPEPANEYTASIPVNSLSKHVDYTRLRIRKSGALQPWFMGLTIDGAYVNGLITYIAAQ